METIYNYQDYRSFIRDFYLECRNTNPSFSLRSFAAKTGLNVSNITRIINGQRNISDETMKRLIDILKLHEREAQYFTLLVQYGQARKPAEKRAHYDQILRFRKTKLRNLGQEKDEYFVKWYNVALRELINIFPKRKTSSEFARLLVPSPRPAEIRKSLNLLMKLGLIQKKNDGSLELKDQFVSTPDEWTGTAIHSFQLTMAQLGMEALDRFAKSERDISTLTLSLSGDGLSRARKAIGRLREEIIEIANSDTGAERVFQLNMQLFPLSENQENK